MTVDVLTARHRPVPVDIRREGKITAMDTLLPGPCATATCHHREHQLTKAVEKSYEEPADVIYSRGWAAPSPYMMNLYSGRTHRGTLTAYRRWWQFWKPRSVSWEDDIPCYESECDLPHEYSPYALTQTLLELPVWNVQRGGIRFPTSKENGT